MGLETQTQAPSMHEQRMLKLEAMLSELTDKDVEKVINRYEEAIGTIADVTQRVSVLEKKISNIESNVKTLSFNAADGKVLKTTEALKTLQTELDELGKSFNDLQKKVNEK